MTALIHMSNASGNFKQAQSVDLHGIKYFAFFSLVEILVDTSFQELRQSKEVLRVVDSFDRGPYLDSIPNQFCSIASTIQRGDVEQLAERWLTKCRFNRFEYDYFADRLPSILREIIELSRNCLEVDEKLFFLQDYRLT